MKIFENKYLEELQLNLQNHSLYKKLDHQEAIKIFSETHIYAVWDFMSLLKSLQNKITSTNVPWTQSIYSSDLVRFINEIVLGEESDINFDGQAMSHFEMYKLGMKEVGGSVQGINEFLQSLDFALLTKAQREFVQFNLDIALNAPAAVCASVFFFGREKLIPGMFEGMLQTLGQTKDQNPQYIYYFQRHIEVDGDEHGPMAMKCLTQLIKNADKGMELQCLEASTQSLELRIALWDECLLKIEQSKIREINL